MDNGKKYGYSSVDNITGKKFNTEMLFNFKSPTKTKNKNLFRKILAYGDRGKILWNKKLDLRDPQFSLFPALNWNTDEFSCAIGYANLKRLKSTNYKRNQFFLCLYLKKII